MSTNWRVLPITCCCWCGPSRLRIRCACSLRTCALSDCFRFVLEIWQTTHLKEGVNRGKCCDGGFNFDFTLIAWPALLIPHFQVANLTVVAGLGLCGYLDFKQSGYQPWFKGLRIILTTVASISLLSTLILSFILAEDKEAKTNDSNSEKKENKSES